MGQDRARSCRRKERTTMNVPTATPELIQMPLAKREAPSRPDAGIPLNAHAVIFSLAIVLALATASECHSITYLPSLQYGAVLWGWWGCIASVLWMLSRRSPFPSGLSTKAVSIHALAGLLLG